MDSCFRRNDEVTVRPRATGWTGRGLRRERWHGYLFIAPAFAFLALVVLVPLLDALWTSLLRVHGLNVSFVGLRNYVVILSGEAFWSALGISCIFTIVSVSLHLSIGLGLALLLNGFGRFRDVLRLAFLVPWMVAPAIGATIWLWLLDPQFGVLNFLLRAAGLIHAPLVWLGTPHLALGSVIAAEVWRGVPFIMLLLLAGLLTIPRDQYEAAALDGATRFQQFVHVTLPNLKALLVIASTLDIIIAMKEFDIINVMTGGGPVGATNVVPVLIYNTGFRRNDLGGAAAIGVLLLIIVLVFSSLYVGLLKPAEAEA